MMIVVQRSRRPAHRQARRLHRKSRNAAVFPDRLAAVEDFIRLEATSFMLPRRTKWAKPIRARISTR
jgi:hypothetical protein